MQDQQRVGMDVVGLDYAVLPVVFDFERVPQDPEYRRRLFEEIVIVNHAVQEHRAEEREAQKRKAEMGKRVDV